MEDNKPILDIPEFSIPKGVTEFVPVRQVQEFFLLNEDKIFHTDGGAVVTMSVEGTHVWLYNATYMCIAVYPASETHFKVPTGILLETSREIPQEEFDEILKKVIPFTAEGKANS